MPTVQHTFRLDKATIKAMDALVLDPPPFLVDGSRGAPRNRTELVERLMNLAIERAKGEKTSKPTKG